AQQSFQGATRALALTAALAGALADLARAEGATLFMVLLAGFQALLHRYTGQDAVLVGTPIAGRSRPEIEPLLGFFVGTLVLRTELGDDPPLRALLARVRETTLDAYAHQDVPFEKLVEELRPERWLSRAPLFQVVLAFQERQLPVRRAGGLTLTPRPLDTGTAKFDLLFEAAGEGATAGRIEYSTELFDRATVMRLADHLGVLLAGAAARPETPIGELPLVTAAERRQLLAEWNDTRSEYPRSSCLHELLAAEAARRPDAVAAVAGGVRLTYGELDRRANRLARHLRRLGVGPEVLVGLLCERSLELVVAIAGILKSGGAYVPLDPGHPPQRLALILAECASPVLLAQERLLAALPESALPRPRPRVVCLDSGWPAVAAESDASLAPAGAGADSLAYVMYTSGSTGLPKGVGVGHRAVVRLVRATGYAAFGDGEVFLLAAPPAFDASTLELWGPLLNGGRLVIFAPREPDLEALGAALAAEGVTTLWLTAGLFHQAVESHLESLRPLRQLLAGGDVLAPAPVRRLLAELPGTTLINGYGPTEGVTFSCCQPLRDPGEVGVGTAAGTGVAIGRPIANTTAYVLDRAGEPSPIGVAGELAIGGDGLARGYLHRPGETAARFVPDPFGAAAGARLYLTGDRVRRRADGRLEFLGRFDRQVKIRGFRIEPGEIESALARHPRLEACAVTVCETAGDPGDPGGPGDPGDPGDHRDRRLVAYVVPRHEAAAPEALPAPAPSPAELRAFLRERLPEPLVPAAFVQLPALPLTANGKVDRAALPAPAWGAAEEAKPRQAAAGAEDEILAAIFADLLGAGPGREVGAGDDFFALGGHSLLATQVVSRVRATFGVELPLRSIFEAPTAAALGERVRQARGL
ncbi:MAG: amino acid adenylation domain-containing protein, partial [Acidobacteria bacterium]|nr:amino acid adenylation domain-containing protein [Acidobacteriota bacterium]